MLYIRYSVRCPFPDDDKYCFVLDNKGNVHYYDNIDDAQAEAAKYVDAIVKENKFYGF